MKTALAITFIVIAVGFSSSPVVADEHAKHSGMQGSAAGVATMVDGLVKKVDKVSGKVTIAHGPMANFNMPAMTMVFQVKNAAWLDQMKEGDTIRFMADKVNGAFTVIHLEHAN